MAGVDRNSGSRRKQRPVSRWAYVDPPEVSIFFEDMWSIEHMNPGYYEREYMPSLNDIFGGAGAPPKDFAFDDADFQERYPTVYHLMASLKNDAGSKRQVCSLTLVCEAGQLKLGLRERDHDLSLWTSAPSLAMAFSALEEALAVRPSQWRKPGGDKKGR
jgi:hypothetical protein